MDRVEILREQIVELEDLYEQAESDEARRTIEEEIEAVEAEYWRACDEIVDNIIDSYL